MYPGYLQDRKCLDFAVYNDTECGTKLVSIMNTFNVTSVIKLKISKNEIRKLSIYSILTFSIGTTILPVAGPAFAVGNPASHTITCDNLNPILLELRAGFKPNNDKGGFDELPDSTKFLYNVEQGRGLKNQAKKVWRNPKAKKEILIILKKFDKDDRIIEEKSLKGFRDLTELKKSRSGPRVIIHREKNEKPTIVGFCMRRDLDSTLNKLKNKFN